MEGELAASRRRPTSSCRRERRSRSTPRTRASWSRSTRAPPRTRAPSRRSSAAAAAWCSRATRRSHPACARSLRAARARASPPRRSPSPAPRPVARSASFRSSRSPATPCRSRRATAASSLAARRAGAGRVVQLGYDETWRWRLAGSGDAPTAHRDYWSTRRLGRRVSCGDAGCFRGADRRCGAARLALRRPRRPNASNRRGAARHAGTSLVDVRGARAAAARRVGVAPTAGRAMTTAFISHSDCGRHDTGWGAPEHVGRLRAITRAFRERPELFMRLLHHEGRHADAGGAGARARPSNISLEFKLFLCAGGGRLDRRYDRERGLVARGDGGGRVRARCRRHVVRRTRRAQLLRGSSARASRAARSRRWASASSATSRSRRTTRGRRTAPIACSSSTGTCITATARRPSSRTTPDIHFVSMHQWPWYPGTGAASERGHRESLERPAAARAAARSVYVDALRSAHRRRDRRLHPRSRADLRRLRFARRAIRSADFTLEMEHVATLTRELVERAEQWCGGRVVSALEGGYAPERLGEACMVHLEQLG